jgi:cysteine desulfurase
MDRTPIYLDYNATTPIDPRVVKAMTPYLLDHFGNPSSPHPYGVEAKRAVESAREQLAALLGARPGEIIFTSGGTEANNMAIKGVAGAYRERGDHLITTAVEHPAVVEPCQYLRGLGYCVTIVPVDETGWIDPADVEKAITPETILVSVMHANNEVGTIQSIAEIADIAHWAGALMHTDAAQSVGKIPVKIDDLGVDLLSIAGHKMHAPKGVGALFVRDGVQLTKFMHGGGHERDRRAGTENVLEIVGLGAAAEIAAQELDATTVHLAAMRDRLWEGISTRLEDIRFNGHPTMRLPNTLSVGFAGLDVDDLLYELWDHVAASAGAACHSEGVTISAVLQAMAVPLEYAMCTLRFSTGRTTTVDEIDQAVEAITGAAKRATRRL